MTPSTFYGVDLPKKDKSKKRKLNSPKLNVSKLNGICLLNQNNEKRQRLNSVGSAGSCSSDSCCSTGSEQSYVFSFKTVHRPTVRIPNVKVTNDILEKIRKEMCVPPCISPIPSTQEHFKILDDTLSREESIEILDDTLSREESIENPTEGKDKEEKKKLVEPMTRKNKEEVDKRETYRRSPNGFLLAAPLPKGEILVDTRKQKWRLGKTIGCGGFGEIYLASRLDKNGVRSGEDYVVKLEPHDNGPLFVEINFYLRAAKEAQVNNYREERKDLTHLGVPSFVASGSHQRKFHKYRFLVMRRYGVDLQKILDNSKGKKFSIKTICAISLQVLDSLEYMHHQGYVHKDLKGSNLLVGLGKVGQHLVNLVDFGLSAKYVAFDHLHKQYTHDERWAHEGTLEYTSRDAHIGCASRRGDLEVLVYNLVEWAGGSLPWDRDTSSCEDTKAAKFGAFSHIDDFLKTAFKHKKIPQFMVELMKYVNRLHFEDQPNYNFVRDMFRKEMKMEGLKFDGQLNFQLRDGKKEEMENEKQQEDKDTEIRRHPGENIRVSAVFDNQCVSEKSWFKKRETIISNIAKESMNNPTQAMLDIMYKIKQKQEDRGQGGGKRKRQLSRRWSTDTPPTLDGTSLTPAMEEVLRLCKISGDPKEEDTKDGDIPTVTSKQGAILPSGVQLFDSLIPSPITLDDDNWPTTQIQSNPRANKQFKLSKTESRKGTGSLMMNRVSAGRVSKGELRRTGSSFEPRRTARNARQQGFLCFSR